MLVIPGIVGNQTLERLSGKHRTQKNPTSPWVKPPFQVKSDRFVTQVTPVTQKQ